MPLFEEGALNQPCTTGVISRTTYLLAVETGTFVRIGMLNKDGLLV